MVDFAGESLVRPRLSAVLVDRITALIYSGELKPGDELPAEAELARRFSVSKSVVREALQRLAEMGVADIRHGRPTTIRAQGPEPLAQYFLFAVRTMAGGLREVVGLRRALETYTASLAAQFISDEELDELRSIVALMDKNRTNSEVWIPANARFHLLLVRASRNTLVTHLFQALSVPIEESMRKLHSQRHVREPDETFRRHAAILEAMEMRDPKAAAEAMQKHFDATEPAILAVLAREEADKAGSAA